MNIVELAIQRKIPASIKADINKQYQTKVKGLYEAFADFEEENGRNPKKENFEKRYSKELSKARHAARERARYYEVKTKEAKKAKKPAPKLKKPKKPKPTPGSTAKKKLKRYAPSGFEMLLEAAPYFIAIPEARKTWQIVKDFYAAQGVERNINLTINKDGTTEKHKTRIDGTFALNTLYKEYMKVPDVYPVFDVTVSETAKTTTIEVTESDGTKTGGLSGAFDALDDFEEIL